MKDRIRYSLRSDNRSLLLDPATADLFLADRSIAEDVRQDARIIAHTFRHAVEIRTAFGTLIETVDPGILP